MAFDYQVKVYWPSREDKRRTTYTLMNQWFHVKPVLQNIHIDKAEDDHRSHRRSRSQNTPAIGNSESKTLNYTSIPNKTTTHEDVDKLTRRQAYNRRAKLHLRYINHPGKIAQLGLTTRPVVLKMDRSTDGQPHLQYYKSGGYDDFHKAYLVADAKGSSQSAIDLPPRHRQGRCGSTWRHIKEPMQAYGSRTLFIDGGPKVDDMNRVLYKAGSNVNRIQHSVKNVMPISTYVPVNTSDVLKSRITDSYHTPETMKGREYGHWHIIR